MSKLSLNKGRVKQKLQTRAIILNSAKSLMEKKKNITLEDVAAKAKVSRATIYRYFPDIKLLFTEASLDIYHITPESLAQNIKEMSIEDRIFHIQNYYNHLAQEHEISFRRYLSVVLASSVTSKKNLRGARRVEALKIVLQPYKKQFTKTQFNNLVSISTLLMGIDALIVTKDVCDLDNAASEKVLKWGLEMILKGISVS